MVEFRCASIELERDFSKAPVDIWKALTEGIVHWWPKAFYIGTYGGHEPLCVELDPKPGGQFVERWKDPSGGASGGLLWATVITAAAPHELVMTGDCSPQWGGPYRGFTTYRIEPKADGATLKFAHEASGVISESTESSLTEGWNTLLDCLSAYVERGEHPERPASVLQHLDAS